MAFPIESYAAKIQRKLLKKQRVIEAASGRQKADLVLKNATYVNVFSNELLTCDIAVANGLIVGLGSYEGEVEYDMTGKIVCPCKRPCQAQRQDRHREEPEHLEPERRAEDRGDHGGKRAYREPYRHKPRYDAFDYQQNDHCDQPHGRHTKPAGIKQHTAPPIRRLDLRGRRLLLLLTLYLVRKFYARAIIRHMLNFV